MSSPVAEKLVGIEVSVSMLKAACLDASGALVNSAKKPLTPERQVSAQLNDFIVELKNVFGDFQKIGVAVPGLLNRQTNRITISKYIPEHADIDLTDDIRNNAGVEAFLENDANAAAYGEYVLGAGRGSRDMFYVLLGAGVGGAFVFDGKLWRGAGGFAGELGYITVNSDGLTLEEVASAESIVRRVKTRVSQDHTSSLARIREEQIGVTDLVAAANAGDGFAAMMLERTGSYVGTALANVINLLNIGRIVVGGEVMRTSDESVLRGVRRNAGELSFKPSFETTEIVAGQLDEFVAASGVALLAAAAPATENAG